MQKLKTLRALVPFVTIFALLALSTKLPSTHGSSIKTAYTVYDPIIITSDSDFSVFNGSGTVADPYRIENLEISATGSNNAIYISGTTKYFVIANCELTGEHTVIIIDNVAEATLKLFNNTIWLPDEHSNHALVRIISSKNATIVNNTFTYENTYTLGYSCISIESSANSIIENNIFIGQRGTTGVSVSKSDNTIIRDNYFETVVGVNNDRTANLAILDNTFVASGIIISSVTSLDALESLELVNNTVNSLEIGLFKNIENVTHEANDYAQFILINCSGVIIVHQKISYIPNAIAIYYSTNVTVKESKFEHVNYAFLSVNSDRVSFNSNVINEGNAYYRQCNDIVITNNSFNLSKINDAFIDIKDIDSGMIANNNITSHDNCGIEVSDTNNIIIANNSILDYTDSGIDIRNGVTDIEIYGNLFMTLKFHYGIGVHLYYISGTIVKIYSNTFIENRIGILAFHCSNLVIHHNYFINSTESNAIDDGLGGNIWYDITTMEGNYWSDKNETGYYYIRGAANAYDPYPMMPNDSDADSISDILEHYVYGTNPQSNDTDSDGLSDHEEIFAFGTDPVVADTDGDGLNDYEECYLYPTDPLNNDTDDDALSDGEEVLIYHSNPLVEDTDADGVSDFDEAKIWYTNPLSNDTDSDGVTDYYEIYISITNPLSNDTDSDGLSDYDEIYTYHTNATDSDTDNDGLSDAEEIKIYDTDPKDADTDHDGLNDREEVKTYGTNPNAPDSDRDGYTDLEEVNAGTDPNDPTSYPGSTATTASESNTETTDVQLPVLFTTIAVLGIIICTIKRQTRAK